MLGFAGEMMVVVGKTVTHRLAFLCGSLSHVMFLKLTRLIMSWYACPFILDSHRSLPIPKQLESKADVSNDIMIYITSYMYNWLLVVETLRPSLSVENLVGKLSWKQKKAEKDVPLVECLCRK